MTGRRWIPLAIAAAATLAACTNSDGSPNRARTGAVLGSVTGIIVGHNLDSEIGGAVGGILGGAAGGEIGNRMDQSARSY
jgi:uncharacterized protein YcfJ